uniref:Uncharacterized protein n=1 Tax=Panagrolaimus superbus TaxID=310955 RepID=A0A914YEF4_9BILA
MTLLVARNNSSPPRPYSLRPQADDWVQRYPAALHKDRKAGGLYGKCLFPASSDRPSTDKAFASDGARSGWGRCLLQMALQDCALLPALRPFRRTRACRSSSGSRSRCRARHIQSSGKTVSHR